MRIKGWYIDGFGHFFQAHRDDLVPGLTVIYGPNEAGKSTLLAFIRYMLFGFPQARSGEPLYKPQRGGNHGGRLFLEAQGYGYTVERTAGSGGGAVRVVREDGAVLPDVGQLLGVADRNVFQRVFAFGLDELRSFETLDHEAVRERIFSGSILGTGQSAQGVLRTLNERRAALLLPRARSARINALLYAVDEKRAQLARAQQEVRGYETLRSQEEALATQVEALADALDTTNSRLADLEALTAIWQAFYDGRTAEGMLASLEVVDAMPPEAAVRLTSALATLSGARDKAAELVSHHDRCAALLNGTLEDPAGLEALGSVTSALEQRALAAEWADKASGARLRAQTQDAAIAAACAELGSEWDPARLAAYDRSIARLEEIRSHEVAMSEARTAQSDTTARAAAGREAVEAQQVRLDGVRARLESLSASTPESLDARGRAIAELGNLILTRQAERAGLEADERACREAQAAVEAQETAAESDGPPAWLKPAFIALSATLIAVGGWRIALGEFAWIAALLGGLAVAALPLFFAGTKRAGETGAKDRLTRAAAAHAERVARIKALTEHIATLAGELGLPPAPEGQALERARQALAKDEALASQRDNMLKDQAAAQQELEALTARHSGFAATAHDATSRLEHAEGAWMAWKEAAGMPLHLSPPGVIDVFNALRQGQEALRARDEATAEAVRYETQLQAYMNQVGELLHRLEQPSPTTLLELSTALEVARARCEAARTARQQREHLAEELAAHDAALGRAQKERTAAEAALEALLREAGAADETDFRRRARIFEEREGLRSRVLAASRAVELRLGTGTRSEALHAELATAEPDRWPREREALREELEALKRKRDTAIEQRRDAANARQALEHATDIPAIEAEIETLRAGIAAAVREWRVLTLAEALISETLARFERERQPAVIARAASLFGQVTDGTYPRLRQHERGIVVVDRLEGEREAEALSRGTREQLYICIRLGLCHEFSSHSAALPLVMDDVLVNFDAERAAAVGRLFVEVAREQQILLFTSQPHTRDLLRSLDAGVQVVELPRYAGAQAPAPVALGTPAREASRVAAPSVMAADQPLSGNATAVHLALQKAGEPLGKSRLLEVSGVPDEEWGQVIKELTDRGLVTPLGQGRGRTYAAGGVSLPEAMQPPPTAESQDPD